MPINKVPLNPLKKPPFLHGRLRLGYRWSRYLLWSIIHAHFHGILDASRALNTLILLSFKDAFIRERRVRCNICGWQGSHFYPNVGSGYFEFESNCPHCGCIHRYRSMAAVLDIETDVFSPEKMVIEVAPVRSYQAYCLYRKTDRNYLSFDLEKFGMEQGDLTAMRYSDRISDYFICFHVLEHVPADAKAIQEIFRVLKSGGKAILQVPIDWSLKDTIEYGKPNPLETGHVRRYSETGFSDRLSSAGFLVSKVSVSDLFTEEDIRLFGFNRDPIFLAYKP